MVSWSNPYLTQNQKSEGSVRYLSSSPALSLPIENRWGLITPNLLNFYTPCHLMVLSSYASSGWHGASWREEISTWLSYYWASPCLFLLSLRLFAEEYPLYWSLKIHEETATSVMTDWIRNCLFIPAWCSWRFWRYGCCRFQYNFRCCIVFLLFLLYLCLTPFLFWSLCLINSIFGWFHRTWLVFYCFCRFRVSESNHWIPRNIVHLDCFPCWQTDA